VRLVCIARFAGRSDAYPAERRIGRVILHPLKFSRIDAPIKILEKRIPTSNSIEATFMSRCLKKICGICSYPSSVSECHLLALDRKRLLVSDAVSFMQASHPILYLLGMALFLSGCNNYSKVVKRPVSAVAITKEQAALTNSLKPFAKQPRVRLGFYLDAANAARVKLKAEPTDTLAQADYNFAVSRILEIVDSEGLAPWEAPVSCRSEDGGEWSLSLTPPDPRPEYHPSNFEAVSADRYKFRGKLVRESEVKPGLGAPVVVTGKDLDFTEFDEFALGKQVYYGMTLVIRFNGRECEMVLINPLTEETVTFDDQVYSLAADFQAPLALSMAELNPRKGEIDEMFRAKNYKGKSRLARLQIYDPRKIPVLFIHGLSNSPATWMPMIEYLRNDETIRNHYQFWAFSYPSGQPFPVPAATLRRLLDQIDHRYPEHKDIVVVGHSMGGQIANMLITDSGMTLWDQLYDKPPAKMGFSDPTRQALTETLIFKARPDVSRVIYSSASHRGSKKATNFTARLGSGLMGSSLEEGTVTKEALAAVRPDSGGRKGNHLPNSIDVLDPGNPFLEAVNTLKPKRGIPYHSIIGDRGKGGSLDQTKPVSTDGVVPYWSSQMDGAESELIIPSGHWTILDPQGMAEVKRILHQHLEED